MVQWIKGMIFSERQGFIHFYYLFIYRKTPYSYLFDA